MNTRTAAEWALVPAVTIAGAAWTVIDAGGRGPWLPLCAGGVALTLIGHFRRLHLDRIIAPTPSALLRDEALHGAYLRALAALGVGMALLVAAIVLTDLHK